MNKIIAASIFLHLCGCSLWEQGSPNHKVVISDRFTADETEMIYEAYHSWENATHHTVTFSPSNNWGEDRDMIWFMPSKQDILTKIYGDPKGLSNVVGHCFYGLGNGSNLIEIATDIPLVTFRHVTIHEMGHALGLNHDDPGTVMAQGVDKASPDITCKDVEQFCGVWDCDPNVTQNCKL